MLFIHFIHCVKPWVLMLGFIRCKALGLSSMPAKQTRQGQDNWDTKLSPSHLWSADLNQLPHHSYSSQSYLWQWPVREFLRQCCNEDWKWTEDEESLGSEKRAKTKTKILRNYEKSSKTFEDRNFFKDIRRIKDFCRNIKENMQSEKYASWKIVWWYWPL